jgi:hypothetical protein
MIRTGLMVVANAPATHESVARGGETVSMVG